jgi:hypothetical protein
MSHLLALVDGPLVDEARVAGLADAHAVLAVLVQLRQLLRLRQLRQEREVGETALRRRPGVEEEEKPGKKNKFLK